MSRPEPDAWPPCTSQGCTAPAAGHLAHVPTGTRWHHCAAHLDIIARDLAKRGPLRITRYRQPRSTST